MSKSKYIVGGLIVVVLILLIMFVYRVYFMFNRAKVEAYAQQAANATHSPNIAYQLLLEQCQFILKSQDLTTQVKLLAVVDSIENEHALVMTAINNCYSSGMIAKPDVVAPAVTPTTE